MDAKRVRGNHCSCCLKRLLAITLSLATACSAFSAEAWRVRLQPDTVGDFPPVKSFEGEFRFGWLELEAGRAKAKFFTDGPEIHVKVEGGSTGLARSIWKLDATHTATILKDNLQSVAFRQVENYADKTVTTQAVFKPDGVWRQRNVVPDPKGIAKWKRVKVKPLRDIIAAMLFIRSQPLADHDKVGIIAFPGDAPYLVEVDVAGRENITVADKLWPAIKLDFKINKVARTKDKKGYKLEPHKKFRSGSVWISDDKNRIPLRAEVNIFIGYIFGELVSLKFPASG